MNRGYLNGERARLGCADWNQVDAPHSMFGETPNTAAGRPLSPSLTGLRTQGAICDPFGVPALEPV